MRLYEVEQRLASRFFVRISNDEIVNLKAVILQTVLCAIMAASFAAASVVWELDSWSLAKQSGVYFLIISIITLPVAYFANWMKHSLAGVLSYAEIFTAIFVVVWISQHLLWKAILKSRGKPSLHG